MNSSPSRAGAGRAAVFAVPALVGGALAMGISPIFVRFADVGPFASAFWRVGGALPLLLAWALLDARRRSLPARSIFAIDRAILIAGLLFTTDLLFWHLAILGTSVANATFLATLAPVWVVLGSGFFLSEKVERGVFIGLGLCLIGAAFLIGTTWRASPQHLFGDLCGVATSLFFGAYFIAVRAARRRSSAARITFLSSVITAIVLFLVAWAVEPRILPSSVEGASALGALALVSHAGGQGLLAFALGHLPAAFSALVIFLEAIAAALFGWVFLGEPISLAQAVGGVMILVGIHAARPRNGGDGAK